MKIWDANKFKKQPAARPGVLKAVVLYLLRFCPAGTACMEKRDVIIVYTASIPLNNPYSSPLDNPLL